MDLDTAVAHYEYVMENPVSHEAMDHCLDLIIENIQQHFADHGPGWDPLDPAYVKWKVAHGFDPNPNIRTGALVSSFQKRLYDTGFNMRGQVISQVPYAIYCNNRRPFFWVDEETRVQIFGTIATDFREGLRYGRR